MAEADNFDTEKVYAFEPDPDHFKIQEILKQMDIEIFINTKAVANENKKMKLYLNERNLADHDLYPSEERRKSKFIDSITLRFFFPQQR